jgi:septum formation protein
MKYPFIYLASQSPRRQELLKQIGVRFELLLPENNADAEALELPIANEKALDYVRRVTLAKSLAALKRWQELKRTHGQMDWAPILCADTTVSLSGSPHTEILGKPLDAAHATEMLKTLSGKTHDVYSAVAITSHEKMPTRCVVQKSRVQFGELGVKQIQDYVDTGEALGKAGAYGIQGVAASFIQSIQGSYSGIMGLPLYETSELLREANVCFSLNTNEPRNTD